MTVIIVTKDNEDDVMNNKDLMNNNKVLFFEPLIISFTSKDPIKYTEKQAARKLSKSLAIDVPYVRISTKIGFIVFDKLNSRLSDLFDLVKRRTVRVRHYFFHIHKFSDEETQNWLERFKTGLVNSLAMKYSKKLYRILKPKKYLFSKKLAHPVLLGHETFHTAKDLL